MEPQKLNLKNVLVLNGPNLSKLGSREPEIYGYENLADINRRLQEIAEKSGWSIHAMQSNHEGTLIDEIEKADKNYKGIIINAGGLTHYSISLRDAIAASPIPIIEVHISNIFAREDFRKKSVISPKCHGIISGFGAESYIMALWYLMNK